MSQDRLEYWGEKNKIGCWIIKRLTLIKENKSSQINVFSKVFNVWVDARVLAYRNHSFDMHLNYIGSVSCFSPSWIPSRYIVRNPPTHTHTRQQLDVCNILCLLIWKSTFFVHSTHWELSFYLLFITYFIFSILWQLYIGYLLVLYIHLNIPFHM